MIKIYTLIENTKKEDKYISEHGLSLFVETDTNKFVFDFGSSNGFLDNAKLMGVNLDKAEFGFLSHGHYDHSGGLEGFCRQIDIPVYVHKEAFGKYFGIKTPVDDIKDLDLNTNPVHYIGVDPMLKSCHHIITNVESKELYPGIYVLTDGRGDRFNPTGNKRLLQEVGSEEDGYFIHDDFLHEQSLVVVDGEHCVLFAGCAHNGIVNIMEACKKQLGLKITHVISGLHMYNRKLGLCEEERIILGVGDYLKNEGVEIYTGHCTGDKPVVTLKKVLGDRIKQIYTGMVYEI